MIYPSILSADFGNLAWQVEELKKAGYSTIHCDVMDGHFVPNLTFGAPVLKSIKNIKMDVHLMVNNPEIFVDQFKNLPLECITFHAESTNNVHRLVQYLKTFGCKVGVSLNPATHHSTIENIIDLIDLVLVMTVNPGFGGQNFIENQILKIQAVSEMIAKSNRDIVLQVDGGMNEKNIEICKKAGANCFVAGSYIFEAFNHKNFHEILVQRNKI